MPTDRGESDLGALLATMAPVLDAGEYVFLSLADARYGDYTELQPIAACIEQEGLTLVVPHERARAAGFETAGRFRRISLGVHSSLEAVGLTAAFAAALAERNIGANVVAGHFHDHIFVPAAEAAAALSALQTLAAANRATGGGGS